MRTGTWEGQNRFCALYNCTGPVPGGEAVCPQTLMVHVEAGLPAKPCPNFEALIWTFTCHNTRLCLTDAV